MSKFGQAAYEAVLTRGDVSPKAMETLVNVLVLGKDTDDSSTDSSSSVSEEKSSVESKQITGDPFSTMASGEFVPPRYNPQIWAAAMEQSTRLGRCIRTYARNTVGLGWLIEPLQKVGPETPKEIRLKVEEQTLKLQRLFERPNNLMPTNQMFFMTKVDEEATGDGYLEVVRGASGNIERLFHAPAVTMRVRVEKGANKQQQVIGGYVQIRGNIKRYFKEFGDTRVLNAEDGKYHDVGKPLSMDKRASEILHFKLYSPTSTWYGAPRYVSASAAIAGNRLASLRNVKFFENDAVPRMALLVSGGRLTQDSIQSIEDFFKAKVQGTDKAHSVVVIQAEQMSVGFQKSTERTRLELKPLTVGVTEDASFETYRKANDEEIREAFGIAPVFFTTESVNKASAQVSREITNEQELEPDRLEKEYLINQTIVADLLGGEELLVRFRFERMKLTDPLDTARLDQVYAGLAALTPNELRLSIGKPPYPKDYKFADKPMQVATAEMSMQLAEAIIGEFKTQIEQQKAQAQAQQEGGGMGGMLGGEEGGEGEDGGEEAEGGDISEWSGDGSTDESSPVSEESTVLEDSTETDSSVNRIHESLNIGKGNGNGGNIPRLPLSTLLGIATELMADARKMGAPIIQEDRQ